jgi:hypothetical protein
MEIVGSCIICACPWYAQIRVPIKPPPKKKKQPDITVEIYDLQYS